MTEAELQAIEDRANKATPGPFSFGYEDDGPHCLIGDRGALWCRVADGPGRSAVDNARFFACARTDVPALIARVRELEVTLNNAHALIAAQRAIDREVIRHGQSGDFAKAHEAAQKLPHTKIIRDAELRGVKAGLEAAAKSCEATSGDALYGNDSYLEDTWGCACPPNGCHIVDAAVIRALDPASITAATGSRGT